MSDDERDHDGESTLPSGCRSEPTQPGAPAPVSGPCIGCGAICDVSRYVACPECLADEKKFDVAYGRYSALLFWFRRFGAPTIH